MTEGETMIDNRFADCKTLDELVAGIYLLDELNLDTTDDAVARIAELTHTVTAGQREQARDYLILDAQQLRSIANILDAAEGMSSSSSSAQCYGVSSSSFSAQCYGGSITRVPGRWVWRLGGDQ